MAYYLPDDMLIKILEQLPVKSLIRFTTVSKNWQSIITSPSFIVSHLSSQRNKTLLLLSCHRSLSCSVVSFTESGPFCVNSNSKLPLSYPFHYSRNPILGVCNGVVCVLGDRFSDPKNHFVLWNPSLKKHVILPQAIVELKDSDKIGVGFGFAHDDYKIVRLNYHRKDVGYGYSIPPEVEVFSFKTGRWRKFWGVDVRHHVDEHCQSALFLNGVLHWLVYNDLQRKDGYRSLILSFHVEDEVFKDLALPDVLARKQLTCLSLPHIVDSLVVIEYDEGCGGVNQCCDVWMMKDYGLKESWTWLYRINLDNKHIEEVFGFRKNGEALLVAVKGRFHDDSVAYNPLTKETMDLSLHLTGCWLYHFVESLEFAYGSGIGGDLKLQKD